MKTKIDFDKVVITAMILIILTIAATKGHCENLPNAPSNSKKSWIAFGIVAGADFGASFYDSKITWDGLNSGHGCTEANTYLGSHPSQAALYGKNMAITGGLVFVGFAMKKWLHLPIAPYAAMGIDAGKHAHGVYQWYHFKNGACL